MSIRAWSYIWTVLVIGGALTVVSVQALFAHDLSASDLMTFAVLTFLATLAQLFETEAPGRQSYYFHMVFFFAGVLLLPPFFFVLLVTIPHVVEWVKERIVKGPHLRAWYIQPFNIAAHVISGFIALWAFSSLEGGTVLTSTLSPVLAATLAVVAYAVTNHLLVGLALIFARGLSWRASGILAVESFLPDFIFLFLGYIVSVLWELNSWLVLPALLPLVLMHQALSIPQLKQEAQTDGKTGLWNARHFSTLFTGEMERATRFERPLTVIMADLDLLRNINNTYGHIAGDVVLSGIGKIISENIRDYDIAGRFGGEEFAIVLPETGPAEAMRLAERLRAAVDAASFDVSTSAVPIHATMSLGLACFPWDAPLPNELIHAADIAVYQAKLKGRNCVVCFSDVPHSMELTTGPLIEDRLAIPYVAAFVPRPDGASGIVTTGPLDEPPEVPARPAAVPGVADRGSGVGTAAPSEAGEHAVNTAPLRDYSEVLFRLFVAGVIAAGFVTTAVGLAFGERVDLATICLLTALAVTAELLQVSLYGENTVSVSVAIAFAAGLIAGIPGVACVSAGIAVTHFVQRRPAIYKTAFNWSTHVLAGLAPVVAIHVLNIPLQVENLPVLAALATLAALAYYMIDTGLIAGAISLSRGSGLAAVWREQFRWLAGHYIVLCAMGLFLDMASSALGPLGVLVFILPVFMMRYAQKQYIDQTEDSIGELRRLNDELANANSEIVHANSAIKQLNEELFETLAKIIDARDPYVSSHAAKVADYATAIGRDLGLRAESIESVRQAGFLHDIGKIGISEQVLHKPSKLTDEEYEYIKTHAALGGQFVEMCRGLRHLAPFIRHHHERWDGRGYPDNLAGEQIPIEARILAVCDSAEAMSSDRPYRKGMSIDEMIAEIQRCAGTQFDPMVAAAFIQIVERERDRLVVNSAQELLRRQSIHARDLINSTTGPLGGRELALAP